MICVHCGTLNPKDSERCVHCARPPAGQPDNMCAAHPERAAVACCGICDAPLCDECETRIAGTPYCPAHAAEIRTAETATDRLDTKPVLNVSEKAPAGFGQRVQAGLIDLVILGVYEMVVYLVLWALSGWPPTDADAGGWRAAFWLFAVLGPLAYLTYENANAGQTVGKTATDLIALKADGSLMDARTGALRGLLSALSFLLGGIGFWYILWDPQCRALHDRIMDTIVVCE